MPEMNCKNRSVFIGDNREIMLGLNAEIADAIITDPPFNSGQMRKDEKIKIDKKKSKQLGFPADEHGDPIQQYPDKWEIDNITGDELRFLRYKDKDLLDFCTIVGRTHSAGMEAYLLMMADRLLLCHELLKETGSIFLHCDPSANNYLRMLMDAIFGKENFRNEIVWRKYAGRKNNAKHKFCTQHETIFFCAKSPDAKFNPIMIPHSKKEIANEYKFQDADGRRYRKSRGRRYQLTGEERRIYLDESKGRAMGNLWVEEGLQLNTSSKERCEGWTTQKPLALYSRLVKAVTNPGDLVIDPFCGCATTLIAAENAGCRWIGMDIDKARVKLIKPQLEKLTTEDLWKEDFQIIKRKKDFPKRTDNKLSAAERKLIKDEKALAQLEHRAYLICEICKTPKDKFDLEVDHIHPKGNRGGKEPSNFQLLCSRCNRRKGSTKTNKDVERELRKEGLLHEQRMYVHQRTRIPMPHHEDYLKREEKAKKRTRRKQKEDLERERASRQPEIGLEEKRM